MNARKTRGQAGFTLVELIVVILILGILASLALPKFINLGGDARYAKIQGLEGSMKSADAIVHSAALVRSITNQATGSSLTMDGGSTVTLAWNYPDGTATGMPVAAGFDPTTGGTNNTDGLNVTIAAGVISVYPNGAQTPASCTLTFTAATAANTGPTVVLPNTASNTTC